MFDTGRSGNPSLTSHRRRATRRERSPRVHPASHAALISGFVGLVVGIAVLPTAGASAAQDPDPTPPAATPTHSWGGAEGLAELSPLETGFHAAGFDTPDDVTPTAYAASDADMSPDDKPQSPLGGEGFSMIGTATRSPHTHTGCRTW